MDLFRQTETQNLLPFDGEVIYYGPILNPEEARRFMNSLLSNIQWKNDEAVIFGRHIITKRKAAWYGDSNYAYTYSGTTKAALPWTDELLVLKALIEQKTGAHFNSCLLNLYHNGKEGMAWHRDDESALEKGGAIASLSLGAVRKFGLKHRKTKDNTSIMLENGSLLVMKGATQTNWLHAILKTTKVTTPRINLTFRNMV